MLESGVLNLSKHFLSGDKLATYLHNIEGEAIHTIILDDNYLRKIEIGLATPENVIQISFAKNQLTKTVYIDAFPNLRVLNLSSNLLIQLVAVNHLQYLEWISLSGNQLGNIDILNSCPNLVHVDASDNKLNQCPNLKNLKKLHTLLLQQNLLNDLKLVCENLPGNVRILSLANNQIADLNQVKYLASLPALEQLSITKNSCIDHFCVASISSMPTFNYRPFIINWCNNLSILDGIQVSQRENMKAEWLLSQGKGRSFEVGQHVELTEYLTSVSPYLNISYKVDESDDEKMDKILEQKQRFVVKPNKNQNKQSSPTKKGQDQTTDMELTNSKSLSERVSDVEKRRRVQAWLGNTSNTPDISKGSRKEKSYHEYLFDGFRSRNSDQKSSHSDMTIEDLNTSTNLLLSESEFITGEDLPQNAASPMKVTSKKVKDPKLKQSKNRQLNSGHGSLSLIQKHYDSPSPESSERMTELPNNKIMREKPLPKPVSCDQTPTVGRTIIHTSNLHAGEMGMPVNFKTDISFSMSKYEEYEMRPIKPLNTDLQLEMYGSTSAASPHTSIKRPPPLKKNSGITSKHAVTGLKKSVGLNKELSTPIPRSSSKKQSNVGMKKSAIKKEIYKGIKPSSTHRKRQQQPISRREPVNSIGNTKRKKTSEISERVLVSQHDLIDEDQDDTTSNRSYTIRRHGNIETCNREEFYFDNHNFPTDVKHVMAATKIQAAWRGFIARWKNPKVIEVRHELRCRRSEQYISLLCHELQMLKEKQEAEKRMRELQTEAIRFMWAQIRQLQLDQTTNNTNNVVPSGKICHKCKTSHHNQLTCDKNSKTRSPRRSPKSSSPRNVLKSKQLKNSPQKRFVAESESVVSSTCEEETLVDFPNTTTKKADVSWKDDVDARIFHVSSQMPTTSVSSIPKDRVDDTDEGRGSLTTDVDGIQNSDNEKKDNQELKSTVEKLQQQVLQLQYALLSFSDKLVNNSMESENMETIPTIQTMLSEDSIQTEVSVQEVCDIQVECLSPEVNGLEEIDETIIISARDDLPKISLQAILVALDSALLEQELWSLCEQTCVALLKRKDAIGYVSTENLYVRKDGVVSIDDNVQPENMDELFIAPEVASLGEKGVSFKSSIFGLSVTLWAAADFQMKDEEAPSLSPQFESLLVLMSHDKCDERADIKHVLKMCEEYHSRTKSNSLEASSSLFLEASDFRQHKKREIHTKFMQDILSTGRQKTKADFVSNVAPKIRNFSLALKPVGERKLREKSFSELTPHEKLMSEIESGMQLKNCPKPKMFTIKDLFEGDPSLLQKLNILPGQRRKNIKAMQLALRRQQPSDPNSPPRAGVPTPPRALRAEVKNNSKPPHMESSNENCSVILRWHAARVYDKQGNDMQSEAIIGYRIYVNGQPKGMVAGTKTRALLDGLHRSCEYKIHIHAVAALGESDPSNVVIVYITQPDHSLFRPKETQDDSEAKPMMKKQHETSNIDDMEKERQKHQHHLAKSLLDPCSVPKPKVKICAVFPKGKDLSKSEDTSPSSRHDKEMQQNYASVGSPLNNSSDSWTTAVSHDEQNKSANKSTGDGEDIVDRVLRRYGIQKSVQSNNRANGGNQQIVTSETTEDTTRSSMSTDEDGVDSLASDDVHNSQTSNRTSLSSADNITPRSKALLDQLKDELLM